MKNEDIRVQKYLSECGVCSRRKAEEYIADGRVKINGRKAELGDKVGYRDVVELCGRKVVKSGERAYVMLNKPRGYVTTMSDEKGRKCVADLVKDVGARVYPCGRLDKDSEGLIVLTSDGEFANLMTHPSGHVQKVYRVTVKAPVSEDQLDRIRAGIMLDGRRTAPAEVEIKLSEPERVVLMITLHEGRNREIRRMCDEVGLEVSRLKRTAIGNLSLGMLPVGKWRTLSEKEIRDLISCAKVTKKAEMQNETVKTGRKRPAGRAVQRGSR